MWQNREFTCIYCGETFPYKPSDEIRSRYPNGVTQQKKPILLLVECLKCLGPNIFVPADDRAKPMFAAEASKYRSSHELVVDSGPTDHLVAQIDQFKNQAVNYMVQGNYSAAVKMYRQALTLCPHHAETWHNLGICYGQAGDMQQAFEAYQQAVRFGPENPASWNNLGMLYLMADYVKEADYCFDQGIRADPDYPKNYLGKGNVCVLNGDKQKAREYFNLALKKKPDYVEARRALQGLG